MVKNIPAVCNYNTLQYKITLNSTHFNSMLHFKTLSVFEIEDYRLTFLGPFLSSHNVIYSNFVCPFIFSKQTRILVCLNFQYQSDVKFEQNKNLKSVIFKGHQELSKPHFQELQTFSGKSGSLQRSVQFCTAVLYNSNIKQIYNMKINYVTHFLYRFEELHLVSNY